MISQMWDQNRSGLLTGSGEILLDMFGIEYEYIDSFVNCQNPKIATCIVYNLSDDKFELHDTDWLHNTATKY